MSEVDINILWLIFGHIGTSWGTAPFCTMPQSQFQQAITWQVQRDLNYAASYLKTTTEYRVLLERYGNPQAALDVLFKENQVPVDKQPNNDVAKVLLELMRWNVAFGGFRAFNYENYYGWMGGGSFLNKPPPYRALPMSSPRGVDVPGSGKGGSHA
ncbi:hypothetical protein ACSRUE_40470 [Sorangium sp. KYC3313]|uniref:hypothetical protein n=1 Tax=Sorangium sp. KYC3313 TaxID=3449740 RepID=UPI003F8AAC3F